ncbi:MAG TPA: adenylate/guanylate cyclase domain-containing protein [Candidatus Dormibacteraeota bacterium]|nr:adenylate/guanylate cyclase domain-containing protein [Candidatus Dormibacteraeota bacterium]
MKATRAGAPAGTVTMLFTDIEGSSDGVRMLGADKWEAVLEHHTGIIRQALTRHGGFEVRTEGDSFFAVFSSPTAAVAAAAAMQRGLREADWPHQASVRVRMGLHTGEARPASAASGVDYVGFEVSRASRIAAAAHGGQVLVSDTTESLVRDLLTPGLTLRDLGEHRFKDLVRPQRIHQLLIEGLPDTFPPLRSLDATPNNLPTQMTTFIGRERELAKAVELLEKTRLLTLTGPGGSGKTRLALHLAADVLDRYPDGVWLVELAPVTDPAGVGPTIAAAAHIGERPGRPAVDTISASLRSRRLLLVLDNCEHLIAACAGMASALVRSCPHLTILATSREGLNVPGEALMPVPSLRVPDGDTLPPLDELRANEAIALFVDRCSAYQPTFTLTEENAVDIVRICRRLDGVPLALELAAARVRVLSLAQVASRLDDRFRLLTGGGRTVVARQQTLRALIDWSYDLLTDAEQVLFRRLSIFVGGWTLEAAEAVGAGEGIERDAILELLAHLVDKSLVVMLERGGAARYTMLETIREYAHEKLVDSGEAPALRRRHFEYYSLFTGDLWMSTGFGGGASADMGSEYENLLAALGWIEGEPNSSDQELLFAGSMYGPAAARGRIGELRQVLTAALARSDPAARTIGRARALLTTASLAGMQGDVQVAAPLAMEAVQLLRALGENHELAYALLGVARGALPDLVVSERAASESRALFEELGDQFGLALLLFLMADAALERGDYEAARRGHLESLALFRQLGHLPLSTHPLVSLARIACVDGDYARARALIEQALAIRKRPELDNPWLIAIGLVSLGEVDRCEGDPARGLRSFEQALAYGRGLSDDMIVAWSLHNLGHVALHSGDLTTAATRFRDSLLLRWRFGPGADVAGGLAGTGGVLLREGQLIEAVRLFGAVDGMLESRHRVLSPADEMVRRSDLAALRSHLDDRAFEVAFREGHAAKFEDLDAMANAVSLRGGLSGSQESA